MRLDDQEESQNVEDRRGDSSGGGGGGNNLGGLGGLLGGLLGGGGGGGGSKLMAGGGGMIVIVVILSLVLKMNPLTLLGMLGGNGGGGTQQVAAPAGSYKGSASEERQAVFTKKVFGSTEKIWKKQFEKMGKNYPMPTLVLFTGHVNSACGAADAAVGPFYCPGDQKVYIDLSFYADMEKQLGAPGDFARAYVVAHEVGHHVQKILGYSDIVDRARREGNSKVEHEMSVRLELQADYLAGVWAHYGQEEYRFLDPGDIESAMNCAKQIGDDHLQKQATGHVRPEKFTHGTSDQRVKWFRKGFDTGDVQAAKVLFELPYTGL